MKPFLKIFQKQKTKPATVIVSGLPRSGTSMMMKMLEAGGMPPLTDNIRTADIENPKGYYEFERVKKLPEGDTAWLDDTDGKVVKVISALLEHLPATHAYKVIFMRRKMDEILASQKKMLDRSQKPSDKVSDAKLAELYQKHVDKVFAWMSAQPNFSLLEIDYNEMLKDPLPRIEQINRFLDGRLDAQKMAEVVDPQLYRNRAS